MVAKPSARQRLRPLLALAAAALLGGIATDLLHASRREPQGTRAECAVALQPPRNRRAIGAWLEGMGLKTGAELGVQRGNFARRTLEFWPSCESYTLVDVWKQQVNYQEAANVDDTMQEQLYQTAIRTLQPFQNKTKFMRMFTSEAAPLVPNESLDYIYVDARHDYCGCLEDIENWWPKVKPGGIMAGHDYLDAKEVLVHRPNEDWALCMNGTRNEGAVKGAVADFSVRHGLTVAVTYAEDNPWCTWIMRKPRCKPAGKARKPAVGWREWCAPPGP